MKNFYLYKKVNSDPAKYLIGTIGMTIGIYLGYKLGDLNIEYINSLNNQSFLENLVVKYEPLTRIVNSTIGGLFGFGSGLILDKLNKKIMDYK
ncbi:MAG: hypothetical protein PHX15_03185 [Candidatus Nanoarchaeia archaeon]|jgi:hypothetical protein|nr:hypothetical protein [Candidatus Nanoarchaeia archaeon]